MRKEKQRVQDVLDAILVPLNNKLGTLQELAPWLNLPLFLKQLIQVICVYVVISSSWTTIMFFVIFNIVSSYENIKLNSDLEITSLMVWEACIAILQWWMLIIIMWCLPFPSIVLFIFLKTLLDSHYNLFNSLYDRLILERMNDEDLEAMINRLGRDMPAWLKKDDHERVHWLNKILQAFWIHVGCYIEDWIEDELPEYIKIKDLFMGERAPRVASVKVIEESNHSLFIDISVICDGDSKCAIKLMRLFPAGANDIQFQADVRIELKNFLAHMPFIEEINIYLQDTPKLNPELGGSAKVLYIFKESIFGIVGTKLKEFFPMTIFKIDDDQLC